MKPFLIIGCLFFTALPPAYSQSAESEAKEILARFSHEPTIREVQKAAAKNARVNPGVYDDWLLSSRLAYILPRNMRARARSTGNEKNDVRTNAGAISDLVSKDDQGQYELTIDWDLTRIVYNRDQILAARQVERIVNQREEILTTVNKLYFARRQLQVDMALNPSSSIDTIIKMELRIDAITADLDALTGGWFGKQLEKAEKP